MTEGYRDPAPLLALMVAPDKLSVARTYARTRRARFAFIERRGFWRENLGTHWARVPESRVRLDIAAYVDDLRTGRGMLDDESRARWAKIMAWLDGPDGRAALLQDVKYGELAVDEDLFDADPDILNAHGALNVRTGEFSPEHTHRFAKLAGTPYDPAATSALWDALLDQILPDPGLRAYAQKAFGMGLSGAGAERCVYLLHGPTGCGKSTLTSVIEATMGDYACTLGPAVLEEKWGSGAHTSEVMPLIGARACFVHELSSAKRLNTPWLKSAVGGDHQSLAEKGMPYFRVRLVAKLYLVSNHAINMSATDDAAWARFYPIPFETPIANPDRDAINRLMADPGVLAACLRWLLEGCVLVLREGLAMPARAAEMAAEQRAENSVIGEWLAARVERGDGFEMTLADATRDYREWALAQGKKWSVEMSEKTMSGELAAAGFRCHRTKASRAWRGGRVTAPRL